MTRIDIIYRNKQWQLAAPASRAEVRQALERGQIAVSKSDTVQPGFLRPELKAINDRRAELRLVQTRETVSTLDFSIHASSGTAKILHRETHSYYQGHQLSTLLKALLGIYASESGVSTLEGEIAYGNLASLRTSLTPTLRGEHLPLSFTPNTRGWSVKTYLTGETPQTLDPNAIVVTCFYSLTAFIESNHQVPEKKV